MTSDGSSSRTKNSIPSDMPKFSCTIALGDEFSSCARALRAHALAAALYHPP